MKKVKSQTLTLTVILMFASSFLNANTLVVDNDPKCVLVPFVDTKCYSCKADSIFPDNPYNTIQDAINAASNNDTIEICKGTYNESVTITKKQLTLKGIDGQSPADVVIDAGSNTGITLQKNKITLENFKVKSSGDNGIYGDGNANGKHIFKNLIIEVHTRGIYLDNGSDQTFESLNITAGDIGIYTDGNVNGQHTFKDIIIHSTGNAIQIDKGGNSFENLNLTSDDGRGIDVGDTNQDLIFKNIAIQSKWEGILTGNNAAGKKTFNDVNISSEEGSSLYIDGGGQVTFNNGVINSSNEMGIYLLANPTGDHIFNNIKISSKNEALYVGKGGKEFTNLELNSTDSRGLDIESTNNALTIQNITINSKTEGIYASGNVNGNHILKSITINSTGAGIYFENGFSSLSDSNITSTNDRGVVEKLDRDTTISNVEINATKEGILFNSGGNVDITVKNSSITSTQPNDGIFVDKANKLTVDSVCIKKAKRGIYASGNVRDVDIKNTGIKNTTDWAVLIDSTSGQVNNNCFSGAKLANSDSNSVNFDGNYWDGVTDSNGDAKITHADSNKIGSNVVDNSPKSSCEAAGCGGGGGSSSVPDPIVNYQMDECSWNGTSGEVIDSANGDYNAIAQNGANTESNTTAEGGICHVGKFDGEDDYIQNDNISDILKGTASLSFWIKTEQTGDDTNWRAPGITGVEQAGDVDDIFWGWIDANGHIGISKGDNYNDSKSNKVINDNQWHHIVLMRDSDNGDIKIYIDGESDKNGTTDSGVVGTSFQSIGKIEDTGGTPEYFQGEIDEVKVFDKLLTQPQISTIYINEKDKKNYDGTTRNCQICVNLKQCYTDNFNGTELGNQWTIIKEKNYTPQIESNKLMLTENDKNIATGVTLGGKFPANDNYIVIEFEHNAYGNNGHGADGITVALADASVVDPLIDTNVSNIAGAYGGSLGYAQRSGIHGFKGGWLGIGLDEFGNYSNPTEGRIGGPEKRADAIAIRGHWDENNESNGYEYIKGTETLDPGIDASAAQKYKYKISIDTMDSTQKIKIERDTKDGNGYQTIIDWFDASQSGATPPQNFKLSFTGSTGGVKNNHSIDYLNISAVSCGTLGEDENEKNETKNYKFDAWNADFNHNINDRNITTKIVKQDFNLTIASLNENGTNYQEFNGTVCSHVNGDSSWQKSDFRDINTTTLTFNIASAVKDTYVNIVWIKDVDESCPLSNEDNSTISSDHFAIRPKQFNLNLPTPLKAGNSFSFNVEAVNNNDNPTSDYNVTGINIDINISDSSKSCDSNNSDFNLTSVSFTDGVSNNSAKFDDVGNVDVNLTDKTWANVDSDDTPQSCEGNTTVPIGAYICLANNTNVTIDPDKFKIVNYAFIRVPNNSEKWLYMANVSDINMTISYSVEAQNESNATTENFDAQCYASSVGTTMKFTSTNIDGNASYFRKMNKTLSSGHDINLSDINWSSTINDQNFTDGKSSEVIYALNVYRMYNNPKNPMDINVTEINTTSPTSDNIGLSDSNGSSFYFGRLKVNDIKTSDKNVTNTAYIEVYDNGSSSYVSGFDQKSLNWYKNKNHNDLNEGNILEINATKSSTLKNNVNLITTINNPQNGDINISINNNNNNGTYTMHAKTKKWLWYIPSDYGSDYDDSVGSTCTTHPCFKYTKLSNSSGTNIFSGTFDGSDINVTDRGDYIKYGVKVFR